MPSNCTEDDIGKEHFAVRHASMACCTHECGPRDPMHKPVAVIVACYMLFMPPDHIWPRRAGVRPTLAPEACGTFVANEHYPIKPPKQDFDRNSTEYVAASI